MDRQIISTDKTPAAIGPYNQAIKCGNMLYTSGQIALDPATGEMVGDDIKAQAAKTLENLMAVLAAGGAGPENVVKTTCFLDNMDDFVAFNEIYQKFFSENPPARSCFAVEKLPKGALVEIEAVAMV